MPDEEHIDDELASFRETADQVHTDTLKMLDNRGNTSAFGKAAKSDAADMDTDDKENTESAVNARPAAASTSSRGSRGAKASTSKAKPAAAPRRSSNVTVSILKTNLSSFQSATIYNINSLMNMIAFSSPPRPSHSQLFNKQCHVHQPDPLVVPLL